MARARAVQDLAKARLEEELLLAQGGLQVIEGEEWAKLAESSRTERRVLPARRGALYDRNGVPLAVTQEFYHVGIAPNELDDPATAYRLLVRNLGVSAPALDRQFRGRKRWIYLHGPFNATWCSRIRAAPEPSIS